ncbi:MAG: insulinase family protein [Alphaproteobacteria bacterium]|jgi:predicted Zn-dependent peptidase|nr:insulinase family protein [Alphaproteobacteria bacterium]
MLTPKLIKLDNNLTVVMDYLPHVESATVGIWSNIGSRVETLDNNGICHFLEHMVFKGTKNRTSFQISEALENKGGYINAWTSKEKTAWYAKVLKNDVNLALEVLLDILRNSTFPAEELEKERGVIIEEIKMYQDDPQDVAYNLYDKLAHNGHSLAYPIIGTEENIRKFSQATFFNHMQKYYHPSQMVIVISGNFSEENFLAEVKKLTANWQDTTVNINKGNPTFNGAKEIIVKKEIEQTNLLIGWKAVSYIDDNYHKFSLASTILGGGMSSRLFNEIREKRGLAYSINSFLNSFIDCGSLAVSAGCSHDKATMVIDLVKEELHKVAKDIEDKELDRAKNLLKSSIVMSLESSYNRAAAFAANILNFGKIRDVNELINKIDSVEKKDIINIFENILNSQETIAIVSNSEIKGF